MQICVYGLWHLGTVTAACLAAAGHDVVGLDLDRDLLDRLQRGEPAVFEPGLADLLSAGIDSGRLRLSSDAADALEGAQCLWVTYDTPVDSDDRADVEHVFNRIRQIFPHLDSDLIVLISSQLPVGTTATLAAEFSELKPDKSVNFAYSPENLRMGKAIDAFANPDRVVVGVDSENARQQISALLDPVTDRIDWMSVESAEMTKHALNAFLATSVVFANEIACLCEEVGADAKEVERGLKSDERIGHRAYLTPGAAFAGGTLARDVEFLNQVGTLHDRPIDLINSIRRSNERHKLWTREKLVSLLSDVADKTVAVWGLTYKPGTDTLRRSSSVELCQWLRSNGATIKAYDPAVPELPNDLKDGIELAADQFAALEDAVALVVATEWPEFRETDLDAVVSAMREPLIVDANGFLADMVGHKRRIRYATIGRGA